VIQGQSSGAATALSCGPIPFVVHQNPTNELGSNPNKMRAIFDLQRFSLRQPQIYLMGEPGTLQSMVRPMPTEG
jgi:hypothetical protein